MRRIARHGQRSALAANLTGGAIVFVSAGLLGPGNDLSGARLSELLAIFGGLMAVVFPLGNLILVRTFRPVAQAVRDGTPVSEDLRRIILAFPWVSAIVTFGGWLLAAVVFPLYSSLRLRNSAGEVAALAVVLVLGGLATMALMYLMNERDLRPLLAVAFRAAPPRHVRGVAVGPRLLLSWGLGSAVPLAMIAVSLLDPEATVDSLRGAGLGLITGAVVVGWAVTVRAARSVAGPLSSVREAMRRVGEGDLDAAVEIDDATEIGLLQAGFNEMVVGLRERERVRDLFGRHVGEGVAARALEEGVRLGGEVRDATALFVDLSGSTRLAATRPPGEVVTLLNEFFALVVAVTEREGGLVNKFEGDAALCVFGAPAHQADHAGRALRAARRLRDEIDALRRRHPELDAGIGVSTGSVVAGNVGSERRLEYTVIGDPVNEAARLTDEAKLRPGRVLASEAAVQAAGEGGGRWREAATLELRGRATPTRAYEPD